MINFSLLDEAYPNDDKTINKKKKKSDDKDGKESCKPLQAPPYTVPIPCADDSVKKFLNVLDMTDNKPKNDYKKDGIRGYDYDEMDAYLTVNDIKTNNTDQSEEYRTTPFLANYLRSLRDNFKKPMSSSENIEQFTNMNNIKIDVNLYNLFLFIFLGIVIIVLIDQITKLVSI